MALSETEIRESDVEIVTPAERFDADLEERISFMDSDWLERAAAAGVSAAEALRFFRDDVGRQTRRLATENRLSQ